VYTTGGTVSVTVTDTLSGCSSTTDATIIQTPAVDIADQTICGDTAFLDATNIYTDYAWFNGDSLSTSLTTTSGIVWVVATDDIGCMTTDSANIVLNPLPTVSITGASDTICVNYDLTLDAGAGFTAYSWSTGGAAQTEGVTGSGLALGDNVITVTVTDGNGCMNTSSTSVFVDPCVGLDELALQFNLYPNPSTGVFYLQSAVDMSEAIVQVTDATGKVVLDKNTLKNNAIDLSTSEIGTYFLTVEHAGQIATIRLVKL